MDRLDSMAVFTAAVQAGSLSAAGRKLGMPLATVSRKVSELEAHIGTTLLRRSTRQLELTDAGRDYLEACRRILADVEESERAASGEYSAPRGGLMISAPVVFGRLHVLPIVNEFLRAYRDVDVHLNLGDRAVNLLEEHVDLAVRIGELPDSGLIARRAGEIRKVVCASPDYFTRRARPRRPDQLPTHECITFDGLDAPERWVFGQGKARQSIAIHSRLIVNTADAAIAAAIAGAGITRVLSYQIAEAVRSSELEILLARFESPPLPLHLLYAGSGRMPLKLRAFVDFALPRLEKSLLPMSAKRPA